MSELFGGLLKPGDGSRFSIERHLKTRREFWSSRKPPEWIYSGPEDFILTHGRYFQGATCPDEYRAHCGPLGQCYLNSLSAVSETAELTYYEGVYDVGAGATGHAWAVDRAGKIVELTFMPDGNTDYALHERSAVRGLPPEHWAYYGVPIAYGYVEEHKRRFGLGVLREDCGLRILTYHFDPQRTSV